MRDNLFRSANAVCPFYRHEERTRVHCEGICGSTSIHVVFTDPKLKHEHKKLFCCNGYINCPLYKLINNPYKEDK